VVRGTGTAWRLILAAVVAAAGAPSAASAAPRVLPVSYKLAAPAPGHVTVAALEVTVAKHGRGRPAGRVLLTLPGRFAMPESVRIFYARRRLADSPLRYQLLLLAVNRASGRGAQPSARRASHRPTADAAARAQFDSGNLVLTVPSRPAVGHSCGSCGKKLPSTTRCSRCWVRRASWRQAQAVNADTGSADQRAALVAMLQQGWTAGGDTNPVFGNPSAAMPRDGTLDTGYFDDGRAFGWQPDSLRDTATVLRAVVDDLVTGQPQKLVPDLELLGQADLNANGVLD
jgi:hypothetical protein